MSKKNKSVLSIMLAIVLAFAPMTSLKAMAGEGELEQFNPVTVDTTEYYSVSATIVTDAGEENYVVYQGSQSCRMRKDGTIVDETEYLAEYQRVAGLLDTWVNENGYSGVGEQNFRSESGDRVVTYYLNDGTEVDEGSWNPDNGYTVTTQNVFFFWTYYYDARNNEDPGQEPQVNYTYEADPVKYYEGSTGASTFASIPEDCVRFIEIDGVEVSSGWNPEYNEYGVIITFDKSAFEGLGLGEHTLRIVCVEGMESNTILYVLENPLDNYDYECLSGNNAVYIIGSGNNLVFVFDVPYYLGEAQIENIDSVAINSTNSINTEAFSVDSYLPDGIADGLPRIRLTVSSAYLENIYKNGLPGENAPIEGEPCEYRIEPHFTNGERFSNATFTIRMPYTYKAFPSYRNEENVCYSNDEWFRIDLDAPADSLTSFSINGTEYTSVAAGQLHDGYVIGNGAGGMYVTLYRDIIDKLQAGDNALHFTFVDGQECDAVLKVKTLSFELLKEEGQSFVHIIGSGESLTFSFDAGNVRRVGFDGNWVIRKKASPTPIDRTSNRMNNRVIVQAESLELDPSDVYDRWVTFGYPYTITLPDTFLDSLEEGVHTLDVQFDDTHTGNFEFIVLYGYEILDGAENDYNGTEGGEVSIRINGPKDMVQNVLVDDKVINPSNYDLTEGSTIVTFHEDYLKTLTNGEHTVQVEYKRYDGVEVDTAKATITVTQSTAEPTDDNSSDNNSSDTSSSDTNSSDTNSSDTNSGESASSGESSGTGSDSSDNKDESSKTESGSSANESSKTDSSATDSSNKDNSSKEDSQSGDSDKPKTGDAGVVVAACLLMVSLIGIAGAVVLKKKFAAEK